VTCGNVGLSAFHKRRRSNNTLPIPKIGKIQEKMEKNPDIDG
jgi:hypothetical protein